MDERLLCPEAHPHGAVCLKAQRPPQADGGEFPDLCCRDLPQEAHGAVRRGQRRVVPGDLDGVQGITPDQLGQELREGVGAEVQLSGTLRQRHRLGAKLTFSLTMLLSLNSGDTIRKPTGRQG